MTNTMRYLAVGTVLLAVAGAAHATICIVPDDGSGTAGLPPNCTTGYLSPDDVHKILSGLPPGTTIEVGAEHFEFFVQTQGPGGSLGGEFEQFSSFLQLQLTGTGSLAGWTRTIGMPAQCETHIAPRIRWDPVQDFDTLMFTLQGQITGDPDFDLLRITAGNGLGMPSPGHTTLTQQPGGNWAVDSFFDIFYRIDFVGAPGGPLAGMSGSTTATIRMRIGDPACGPDPTGDHCLPVACPDPNDRCVPHCVNYNPATQNTTVIDCQCRLPTECQADIVTPGAGLRNDPCVVPDNGGGTIQLPPQGCEYLSPDQVHKIIDGLPPGTTIEFAPIHKNFICDQGGTHGVCSFIPPPGLCEDPTLTQDCFDSTLALELNGTGTLLGFHRNMTFPVSCEVHSMPRTPGQPVQSFDTDMFRLQGQIVGDPDFDLLRITGGSDFGMPSPGHTTLTRQAVGGPWAVDSFFDITYRIDFIGAAGGPLAGRSGSTTATIRMQTGFAAPPTCVGGCPTGMVCNETIITQPDGSYNLCCDCATEPPAACCFLDGTCQNLPPSQCQGTPQAPGSVCLGDANGDGIDDACDCDPMPNGTCGGLCADPTVDACLARCIRFDPATGQSTAIDCNCQSPNECHVGLGIAGAGKDLRTNPCDVIDNGGGTITLPPAGCDYLSPDDVHRIIDGLPPPPPTTTIELAAIHKDFICRQSGEPGVCSFLPDIDCEQPGGTLGGQEECSESNLQLNLTGTGALSGYSRALTLPASFETHVGPRTPGQPIQSFDTDMFRLFGEMIGDPDFDLLRIVAGTDWSLPSPGHTTLVQQPGNMWAVDSFFDITYRIDFVGAPGGPLAGMSGSTTATIRMATGNSPPPCIGGCPPCFTCVEQRTINPDGTLNICCLCEPVKPTWVPPVDSVGAVCILPLNSGDSEPRLGRIRHLIFHFDCPPSGMPLLLWDNSCPPPPTFVPYGGASTMTCIPVGNDLSCTFAPPLEDRAAYLFDLSPVTGNAADQFVVRGLAGDVNNSKLVSGADVSSVNANWGTTNCRANVNEAGNVSGADVSSVNANWGHCAP
jgi:hypothetical protein